MALNPSRSILAPFLLLFAAACDDDTSSPPPPTDAGITTEPDAAVNSDAGVTEPDAGVDVPPLAWQPFVRGTFNDWQATDPMTYMGNRVYAATVLVSEDSHEV